MISIVQIFESITDIKISPLHLAKRNLATKNYSVLEYLYIFVVER